jgi:hypothetical protein
MYAELMQSVAMSVAMCVYVCRSLWLCTLG